MATIESTAARAIAEDSSSNLDANDLLKELGHGEPVEEKKPIELNLNTKQLVEQARTPEDASFLDNLVNKTLGGMQATTEYIFGPGDKQWAEDVLKTEKGQKAQKEISTIPSATETAAATAVAVPKAATIATAGVSQFLSQFVYDLADAGDNLMKSHGITDEEMLSPYKINWKEKTINALGAQEDFPVLLAGDMMQYIAPGVVASRYLKLGAIGIAGANVAIDYALMDPDQKGIANLIGEKYPELRDMAAFGEVIKHLEHRDDDTNWEGRYKNAMESFLVNGLLISRPLASAMYQFGKTSRIGRAVSGAVTNVKGAASRVMKGTPVAAIDAVEQATKVAATPTNPIRVLAENKEIQGLLAKYQNKLANLGGKTLEDPAVKSVLSRYKNRIKAIADETHKVDDTEKLIGDLQKEFKTIKEEELIAFQKLKETETQRILNSNPLFNKKSSVYGKIQNINQLTIDEIVPRTTEDMWVRKADEIIKDPAKVESLLVKDINTFKPEDSIAYRRYLAKSTEDLIAAGKAVKSTEDVVSFVKAFENLGGSRVYETASGRAAGQLLRSRQASVLGEMPLNEFEQYLFATKQGEFLDEAITKIGGIDAYKEYINNQVKLMGGEEAIKKFTADLVGHAETLNDLEKIDFLQSVAKEGGLKKMNRALQFAMYNSMIGVKSFMTATAGNAINTTMDIANNFVAKGLRNFRQSDTYRKFYKLEPLTDFEKMADEYRSAAVIRAYKDSFLNSIAGAGRTLKLDKLAQLQPDLGPQIAARYRTTKLDAIPMGLTTKEQMGITAEMNLGWQAVGNVAQVIGLNGASTKLLGTADTFFGGIHYHQKLSQLVTEDVIKKLASYSNKTIDPNVFENMYRAGMRNPRYKSHIEAMKHAEAMVLAKKAPEGSLVAMIKDKPLLNLVLPFSNVTYASATYALEHSPFAFLSGETRKIFKYGTQFQKDEAMAKIITGTALLSGFAMLSLTGEMTGPETRNWRVAQALQDNGKEYIPYSIRGISVKNIDTLKPLMYAGHILGTASQYLDEGQYSDLLINMGAATLQFMTSNQLIDNSADLMDVINAVSNGEVKDSNAIQKYMANITARFFPAMGREVAQVTEKAMYGEVYKRSLRDYNNYLDLVVNQLKSDVPFWNQDLPLQRNLFGEPQLIARGFPLDEAPFFSMKRGPEDPIMTKLKILAHGLDNDPDAIDETGAKLAVQMPSRVIRIPESTREPLTGDMQPIRGAVSGMPIELNGKMYEKFMIYFGNLHEGAVGPTLRQEFETILADDSEVWKNITKEQDAWSYRRAVAAASQPISRARSRAYRLMMENEPEFRRLYEQKVEKYGGNPELGMPEGEQKRFIRMENLNLPSMLGQ